MRRSIYINRAAEGRAYRAQAKEDQLTRIAVLDFETDPFDGKSVIKPFACCLFTTYQSEIIIWEEEFEIFVYKVFEAINSLKRHHIIYAHNGGRFDYMFLIHKLRGIVKFKGRGLMTAWVGEHELRDSFHIIPEKLANWHKEIFDYERMKRGQRGKYRREIIDYMISDCKYLMEIIQSFLQTYGFRLSIGQAAISILRKDYDVAKITEHTDEQLRPYYHGGRVDCLAGRGCFVDTYRLYDVNSMYPYVMVAFDHPIGNNFVARRGRPRADTCFINLNCTNHGAFVSWTNEGCSSEIREGNFAVTIHEYNVAMEYGLISDVNIHWCIDCNRFGRFDKFVLPLYNNRIQTKALLKLLEPNTTAWNEAKKDDIFFKLLLNNAYGKFAQNPRRYKESFITSINEQPDGDGWGAFPRFEDYQKKYAIWERESRPWRFFNVATGASITGAARAVLLLAICRAQSPIYCDTDSILCLDFPELPSSDLGGWQLEDEFVEIIILGKKLYACRRKDGTIRMRTKGVRLEANEENFATFRRLLDDGEELEVVASAPTLTSRGEQFYMRRVISATAPYREVPIFA